MIEGELVGDREVVLRLERWGAKLRPELIRRTVGLMFGIENHVKQGKLAGQVLNRRKGKLVRSVHSTMTEMPEGVEGKVAAGGPDVPYAAIHEYGGTTPPHVIEAKKKLALRFVNAAGETIFARKVNHPGSKMPERSYMRTALRDFRDVIFREYREGLDAADA